jgi:hypothetical protein
MTRIWRSLTLGLLGLAAIGVGHAQSQIIVTGGRTVTATQAPARINSESVPLQTRRPWRERNRYFVARPNYAAKPPGARANVTFEPFTSRYYPTINSYYPQLNPSPALRTR